MEFRNLKTLAGVSAGSVVAAMLAVGCNADEIFNLVQKLPFHKIAHPELGSLLRILGNIVQSILKATVGVHAAEVVDCLVADVTGPGINSGGRLEEMVGNALKEQCGDAAITLKAVQDRFGKRLVILACELDSGHEKRFTPETDPDLPLRAAVRMSMGVPGLMEPFRYQGHMYCDGGMCNDFPVDALPQEATRMGLMVRPIDWIRHHLPDLGSIIPVEKLKNHPEVMAHLDMQKNKSPSLFSVKSILDLALTSVNIMMDANLVLQIEAATAKKGFRQSSGISGLAPEILTLCGGKYDPFDFNLTKDQHRELFLAGQLSTHLHASVVDATSEVLPDEGKLKTVLYTFLVDMSTLSSFRPKWHPAIRAFEATLTRGRWKQDWGEAPWERGSELAAPSRRRLGYSAESRERHGGNFGSPHFLELYALPLKACTGTAGHCKAETGMDPTLSSAAVTAAAEGREGTPAADRMALHAEQKPLDGTIIVPVNRKCSIHRDDGFSHGRHRGLAALLASLVLPAAEAPLVSLSLVTTRDELAEARKQPAPGGGQVSVFPTKLLSQVERMDLLFSSFQGESRATSKGLRVMRDMLSQEGRSERTHGRYLLRLSNHGQGRHIRFLDQLPFFIRPLWHTIRAVWRSDSGEVVELSGADALRRLALTFTASDGIRSPTDLSLTLDLAPHSSVSVFLDVLKNFIPFREFSYACEKGFDVGGAVWLDADLDVAGTGTDFSCSWELVDC
ncbi:unnamed protein product [Symbiodinium pilosum]|uniref:PNPLA domain-containing protein n=1 Tax=Symbiodinium pilosum TaxID=2952 RepID=A0A812T8C7_SYMPI|nr:unnamed protein product [Symbiodinium pilosum]